MKTLVSVLVLAGCWTLRAPVCDAVPCASSDCTWRQYLVPPLEAPAAVVAPDGPRGAARPDHYVEHAVAGVFPAPKAARPLKTDEACRAAVCVSGQWRSFAEPAIRQRFREYLVGGLNGAAWREQRERRQGARGQHDPRRQEDRHLEHFGIDSFAKELAGSVGCEVDLFFYAKTTDTKYACSKSEKYACGDVAPTDEASIRSVVEAEFPALASADSVSRGGTGGGRLRVVSGDDPMPPVPLHSGDPSDLSNRRYRVDSDALTGNLKVSWPNLRGVQSCYAMVTGAEDEKTAFEEATWAAEVASRSPSFPPPPRPPAFRCDVSKQCCYTTLATYREPHTAPTRVAGTTGWCARASTSLFPRPCLRWQPSLARASSCPCRAAPWLTCSRSFRATSRQGKNSN